MKDLVSKKENKKMIVFVFEVGVMKLGCIGESSFLKNLLKRPPETYMEEEEGLG